MDRVSFRTKILQNHLTPPTQTPEFSSQILDPNLCLSYTPPELTERVQFDTRQMRVLLDGHNIPDRDWLFGVMIQSKLFNPRKLGSRVFVSPDYNQTMEQQREMTLKRILYLLEKGAFRGWLTGNGVEDERRKFALLEVTGIFDHSLSIKVGVHFFLWYSF